MIELDKIGYNILEKEDGIEVTGGLILSVLICGSKLVPDQEAMIAHIKKRIREKIWEMAYGDLREPVKILRSILDTSIPDRTRFSLEESLKKLEEAMGEP